MTGTAGPLRVVLAELEAGATSLDKVARTTGLRRESVDAAVAHLVRIGRLDADELSLGCPPAGCGGCASGADGAPGCGVSASSPARSGPVLVALSVRRSPV